MKVSVKAKDKPDYMNDGSFKGVESFESGEIPTSWQVKNGGTLKLSETHYKHGKTSLRWEWEKDSSLKVIDPAGLARSGESENGGMKFWFYNEVKIPGKLIFRLGSKREIEQDNPRYRFEVGGDFIGWRAVWVIFARDAQNPDYTGKYDTLEVMEIIPPCHVKKGTTFFDNVEFAQHVKEDRAADYQVPYIKYQSSGGKGGVWERTYYYSKLSPHLPLPETITIEEKKSFETISKRLGEWILGDGIDENSNQPMTIRYDAFQKHIQAGLKKYDHLNIKRDHNGNMTGMPLYASRSNHGPKFGTDVSRSIFLPLVYDYKLNGREESKEKLFDLFDYFNDQGWAEGSGLGILNHETNRHSGYFYAVYLMSEELKQTGRLERELKTVRWYANFNKVYSVFGEDYQIINADEIRTRSMYMLFSVLLMEDSPEKSRDMQLLLEWMNRGLEIAPGFAGTIKEDFMGFHHRGVYMDSYSSMAYHTAALIGYLLHDTVFSLAEKSIYNLKNALLTLRIVSNKYDMPKGLRGRMPFNLNALADKVPAYAYMALSEEPVDEDMARVFMRLWEPDSTILAEKLFSQTNDDTVEYLHTLGAIELMEKVAKMNYEPEKAPVGFWIKPSSAFAVLRQDNWLVSVKGWSQYVFDFESQSPVIDPSPWNAKPGQNVLGRYEGYGALQIFGSGDPVTEHDSGYALDSGWNWNRWPGATTIHLSFKDLMKTDDQNPEHRSFTDQTFVGGVSMAGECGLFSMVLHDTVYNPSFWAYKTYFFFGNEVIAVGTGIQNDDEQHPTETTLFQSYMRNDDMPIHVNDLKPITEYPYVFRAEQEPSLWLMDPYGNGYILPDAQGVHIKRDNQHSIDQSGVGETSGLYSTAWIDHGFKPENEGYEYVVLVAATSAQTMAYAEEPHYDILRKDNKAHVLYHKNKEMIGYALFDESLELEYGMFRTASGPVTAMEKQEGEVVLLSISDPDLRLPKLPNQSMDDETAAIPGTLQTLIIELNGQWTLESVSKDMRLVTANTEKTLLEIDVINGKTYELKLKIANE